MTRARVTKAEATKVLTAVRKRFGIKASDPYGPKLIMDFDWLGTGAVPTIVWEEGPYEWAVLDPAGDVCEELSYELGQPVKVAAMNLPDSVWTEPMTSWALSIYPA